ncbi:MAG: SDR family NAD(P)-dependent oxidoreductase [Tepidisphaeraceae bacterium]|jgi:NAD(P)-dependent dehydrogenase (short-subunit alcohol dehydrogenase family)
MGRNLQDMVTVVTGASAGIGRALAIELAGRGSRLVLGARRLDRLEALNRELGGAHVCLCCDVSRAEDCRRLVLTAVEKFGRLDTLVCNAGYGLARPFDAMSVDEVLGIFRTNLFGTIDCCRAAIQIMKRQDPRDGYRGQLMIVSSACARRGLPFFTTYAATKAAQLSLAEGLRVELRPLDIAVTSVHPELVETDFFSTAHDLGGMDPAALAAGGKRPAASCARRMAQAIEKPCRELWPKPLSRLSLTIATAFPALCDFFIARIRNRMLRNNGMLERERPDAAEAPHAAQQPRAAS